MKRAFHNLSMLFVALALALLFSEGFIRITVPQSLSGSWRIATATGLLVNKSNGSARHQQDDRVVVYRFFEPHLRDTSPKRGVRKILTLGDSFTFGWLLEHEDTYVSQLQKSIDKEFGPDEFQLLNAAAGGWGTSDYTAFVEERGSLTDPEIVLVFLNGADIGRSIRNGLFTLADSTSLTLQRHYQPVSSLKKYVNSFPGYQWLLEHSHLVQFLRTSAVILLSNQQAENKSAPIERGEVSDPESMDHEIKRETAIRLGSALFHRLKSWCDEKKMTLVVVGISRRDPLERVRTSAPTQAFLYKSDEFFRELGVPYFDATPQIRDIIGENPERYVINGDPHPNENGASAVARVSWPFLSQVLHDHLLVSSQESQVVDQRSL